VEAGVGVDGGVPRGQRAWRVRRETRERIANEIGERSESRDREMRPNEAVGEATREGHRTTTKGWNSISVKNGQVVWQD